MKLTLEQISDLKKRMEAVNASEIEVVESENGRLQFYVNETKVVQRPLKRLKNSKAETENETATNA